MPLLPKLFGVGLPPILLDRKLVTFLYPLKSLFIFFEGPPPRAQFPLLNVPFTYSTVKNLTIYPGLHRLGYKVTVAIHVAKVYEWRQLVNLLPEIFP